ncbi:MAG: DUF3825 domain-containing protein, partial [Bacteroidia bacterium]
MRINGTVVYYENHNGAGLVREKSTGEFYSLTRNEVHPGYLIIYNGLEVSFHAVIENEEPLATKVQTDKKLKTGIVKNLHSKEDFGYITDRKGRTYWFKPSEVIVRGTKRIQPNDTVQFFSLHRSNHPVHYAFGVACDKRTAMEKFSITKTWDVQIAALANLAQTESWSYTNFDMEPFPLLENYFMHTFENVFKQERIGYFTNKEKTTAYACFHTGLVSKNNEDIYGVFIKTISKTSGPSVPRDWNFSHFTDRWMTLLLQCNPIPLPASYSCMQGFDSFDTSMEIKSNINILFNHQKHFIPKHFLLQGDENCAALMRQAIDNTLAMVKSGKIIPIAKYFYGNIEFIVPLYFNGRLSDTALVIKRSDADFYLAHNLCPLDIAYKNARLLGPVNSDWLKPVYVFSEIPVEQNFA